MWFVTFLTSFFFNYFTISVIFIFFFFIDNFIFVLILPKSCKCLHFLAFMCDFFRKLFECGCVWFNKLKSLKLSSHGNKNRFCWLLRYHLNPLFEEKNLFKVYFSFSFSNLIKSVLDMAKKCKFLYWFLCLFLFYSIREWYV